MKQSNKDAAGAGLGFGAAALMIGLAVTAAVLDDGSNRHRVQVRPSNPMRDLEDIVSPNETRLSNDDLQKLAKALRVRGDEFTGVRRDQLLTVAFRDWNASSFSFDHKNVPKIILKAIATDGLTHRMFCNTLVDMGVEKAFQFGKPSRNVDFWSEEDLEKLMEVSKGYIC